MLNKYQKKELREDYNFMSNQELMEKYHLTIYELRRFVNTEGFKLKKKKLTQDQKYYVLDNPNVPASTLAKELKTSWWSINNVRKSKKLD